MDSNNIELEQQADIVLDSDGNVETEHDDYARSRVPDHAKRGAGAVLSVLVGFVTAFFFILVGGLFLNKSGAAST